MENNKQTSVDYLVENLRLSHKEAYNDLYEVIEQAKAMKNEQEKFTNAPIHDKKAIIEMMNELHPKEMIEVVEFIKSKIETYGKQ